MSDDLLFIGLVLVLGQESFRAGKGNLINILIHLVLCHTQTVIDELDGFLLRIDNDVHPVLCTFRLVKLTHDRQLLKLCDGVTSIADHLSHEDIMV